jgi:ring-1,2-phenylacetyl-CoA epoxidase subunit PaaB
MTERDAGGAGRARPAGAGASEGGGLPVGAPGGDVAGAEVGAEVGAGYQAEGGHGAVPTAGVPAGGDADGARRRESRPPQRAQPAPGEWPLWEVFVRARRGLSHNHVGSLHAPDARLALRNARDVYTRRQEGVSIWVVAAAAITASSPDEKDAFFDPAGDKPYRHPTFYDIPDGVQM